MKGCQVDLQALILNSLSLDRGIMTCTGKLVIPHVSNEVRIRTSLENDLMSSDDLVSAARATCLGISRRKAESLAWLLLRTCLEADHGAWTSEAVKVCSG